MHIIPDLVLYTSSDGIVTLPVTVDQDTVWLTRQQLAELFDRDIKTIGKHIQNALKEEVDLSVVAKFATTATDGKKYMVEHYNLDMIISIGYRVKSQRGVEFRKWANSVLKDYILRGYAVNESRIRQLGEVVRLMKRTQHDLDSQQVLSVILRSGNDAANAVAVLCSGSVEAFVKQMNLLVASIEMTDSHFVNALGYSAKGQYTTARDLVIAARYGMMQPLFSKIVTCLKYTLPASEKRSNPVFALKWNIFDPDSEYYIPHAAGIKSGYTPKVGCCYVGAYQKNGVTLIATVRGGLRRNMAWVDPKRLLLTA